MSSRLSRSGVGIRGMGERAEKIGGSSANGPDRKRHTRYGEGPPSQRRAASGYVMRVRTGIAADEKIRIVVADDHPVVREGLRALVNSKRGQRDVKVVGEAVNGMEAVQQFFLHRPDILLLDLRMPQMTAIEAIQAILEKAPDARIIVLSAYNGDEDIYRALKAGAKAYLLKDSPCEQSLEFIRSVHSGHLSIPPSIAARLAARLSNPTLTDRELEIARLMVAGKSIKEIGAALEITEGTVKVHVRHLLRKLGAGGRGEAVRIALERGIVHLT